MTEVYVRVVLGFIAVALVAIGAYCLIKGLWLALGVRGEAMPDERGLVLMGEACLRRGWYNDARAAFEKARAEMPKGDLIACGEKALVNCRFQEARGAFQAARMEIPDRLIACGEKAMGMRCFEDAREAFLAAGHQDGLIALGEELVELRDLDAARKAFRDAASVEQRGATS